MITYVTRHRFIDYFRGSDQWRNHFSYACLDKLFDLIENDDQYDDMEFCHYAITEEWVEVDTIDDYIKENDLCKINDLVYYPVESWDWDKDGNKLIKKTILINKYQSQ